MQRTTIDFGVDLGTTNSTIAVIDEIDAKVIPNKGGSSITSSAVWIDKRDHIHVGQEAKLRALVEDQDNADLEFKLRMGRGPEGMKRFVRSGREMLPEALSAEVLKSLKMDVQSNMGEELSAAVITVPAAFENSQTNATKKAAILAGFTTSPLLLEPVAASLAYGFQSESENVYWFVYDFGGGTFDAAVMRLRDGLIQVVNHDGNNFLGGKLIDWDIVTKKLMPAVASQYNLPDFQRGNPQWQGAMGKMKYYAEQAKIEVCRSQTPQEIWIEGLCQDAQGKEVDFAYTLTPEDVEQISQPFIEQSLGLCRKTLEQTGLNGSKMDRILMVGGTTLNPWVRKAVQAELGSQIEYGIDPVTVVARGAAIFASTQALPTDSSRPVPVGTWRIQVEHKPVGNLEDPDIGGRIVSPNGQSVEGYTVEFVDAKTQWRSGRMTLGSEGVFMTQLYAERQRRHEYDIELCNRTGTRIPTSPERVSYTLGVIPEENPPAAMTIGIGLANGSVATYIKKGARLPIRKSIDHFTTVPLQAGNSTDELRIPLLEGEHPRAARNHGIGTMIVRGSDVCRDLPTHSQIEITVVMDKDQQVRLQAYVPSLDEDLPELKFDSLMMHNSAEGLRQEVREQKDRLASAREKSQDTHAPLAQASLDHLEDQQLMEHIDSLSIAVESDLDAVAELDRRLRELATALDEVEDSLEWPALLERAEESRKDTQEVVDEYGDTRDKNRLGSHTRQLQKAIDAGDPDSVELCTNQLDTLWWDVLDRQPGFHVGRFKSLAGQVSSMRDPNQAEHLITQGWRAINNGNVEGLKGTNSQLASLLPVHVQNQVKHANIGGTIARV